MKQQKFHFAYKKFELATKNLQSSFKLFLV